MPEYTDDETDEPKRKPNLHSQTIQGLVILFYKNLLSPSNRQYTIAYSLCKAMATQFDEPDYLKELELIYKQTNIGYPLGLVQTVVFRDTMIGMSTNKHYNYGYQSRTVKLGDMILALDQAMDRICDIFVGICVKNDVDVSLVPTFQGAVYDESGI